ncbi:hypothetical protein Pelo_15901 [Pelomyxa schiedti]|nr:hypothetical protein Pelo_15901 [Pelomyxa schiedti]
MDPWEWQYVSSSQVATERLPAMSASSMECFENLAREVTDLRYRHVKVVQEPPHKSYIADIEDRIKQTPSRRCQDVTLNQPPQSLGVPDLDLVPIQPVGVLLREPLAPLYVLLGRRFPFQERADCDAGGAAARAQLPAPLGRVEAPAVPRQLRQRGAQQLRGPHDVEQAGEPLGYVEAAGAQGRPERPPELPLLRAEPRHHPLRDPQPPRPARGAQQRLHAGEVLWRQPRGGPHRVWVDARSCPVQPPRHRCLAAAACSVHQPLGCLQVPADAEPAEHPDALLGGVPAGPVPQDPRGAAAPVSPASRRRGALECEVGGAVPVTQASPAHGPLAARDEYAAAHKGHQREQRLGHGHQPHAAAPRRPDAVA